MGRPLNSPKEKVKLIVALISLQVFFTGFHIVSEIALDVGMSKIVYPVYRNTLALVLLAPIAYFLEKNERPPLTWSMLGEFSFLGLLGITGIQGFYILGLYYASPTFASAIQNAIPAITFVLAAVMGIEKVKITSRNGLAKVAGTLVCIGGATVITLYKGPAILKNLTLTESREGYYPSGDLTSDNMADWRLGCLFLLCQCVSWAAWLVYQAPVVAKYPARLSLTTFQILFGLLQLLVIAAFVERDAEAWKIHNWQEILSVVYAGIVASGIIIFLQIWCVQKGGPVYVAVFQPVQTVMVAIASFLILGDPLYTGGITGAALIMVGLYMVLWGKNEEARLENQEGQETSTLSTSLLYENTDLYEENTKARGVAAAEEADIP